MGNARFLVRALPSLFGACSPYGWPWLFAHTEEPVSCGTRSSRGCEPWVESPGEQELPTAPP